jgi:hypothetical protein
MEDEIEVSHSHIIEKGDEKKVEVHFERPTENGFDVARCSIPSYEWIKKEGFSDKEIALFGKYLRSNAHLFFKYAKNGGINIA